MSKESPVRRERLDRVLLTRGLVSSREQAVRLVLAGEVRVNGLLIDKPAKLVGQGDQIEVRRREDRYVSRAGKKLEAGLEYFEIQVSGKVAMDVGSSTGGFTDCLLQQRARRVYAVDVGVGLLDWTLRNDPRVVVLERQNIRYLDPSRIGESLELVVVDVSFISLTLVLPSVVRLLAPEALSVVLVKPQFEVGKGQVGRGGIVRDETLRLGALRKVQDCAQGLGFLPMGSIDSPILGQKGNREILLGLRWCGGA